MPTISNWAYLAGLIDGEGTVTLRIAKGRYDFTFRVAVYNTCEAVIDWCVFTFGGRRCISRRANRPQVATCYQWYVSSQFACDILKGVLPYLIIKQAKARIAIEAWENRHSTLLIDRRKPMDELVVSLREHYVSHFKAASN